jgi:hypothetical protein
LGSRACLPCRMKFLRFCMVDMVRWVFADEVAEINGRGGRRQCVYVQREE